MIEERYPEWVVTPCISFTGVNAPESYIYALDGTITALSGSICNYNCVTCLMNGSELTIQKKLKSVQTKKPLIEIASLLQSLFSFNHGLI